METRKYLFETKWKQFLTEAEAPQFSEYINLDDLEIKVSATGIQDLIQNSDFSKERSSYNIDLKPGFFEPNDVVTVSVHIKKEALSKMTNEQKQKISLLDATPIRWDMFQLRSYMKEGHGLKYGKKEGQNLQRDGLICRSYIMPSKVFRITPQPGYEDKIIDISYKINLLNNKSAMLWITLNFPENTHIEFSPEDKEWMEKHWFDWSKYSND